MNAKSRTLGISVNRIPDEVYDFVANPENLPKWAPAFCKSVRKSDAGWLVETPDGSVKIRFVARNEFRVVDHYLSLAPGEDFYVPMRVLANGSGSELILTLFQLSTMSDEQFQRDIDMVTRDLSTLKRVLENRVAAEGKE